jgi:hypothetical protein
MPLVLLGVAPHQQSHTATALVTGSHQQLATLRVPASASGNRQRLEWARQVPQRRWAIENARGLGCHLTQWLLGWLVGKPSRTSPPLPPRGSASCRAAVAARPTRSSAAAAAGIAALQGDAAQLQPEDATVVLAMLRSGAATWSPSAPAASTSSMRCCASSSGWRATQTARRPGRRAAARGPPAYRCGPCPHPGCLGPGR